MCNIQKIRTAGMLQTPAGAETQIPCTGKSIDTDVESGWCALQNAEAKISDVGLSKMMHAGAGDHSGSGDACFGTFAWAAPEVGHCLAFHVTATCVEQT